MKIGGVELSGLNEDVLVLPRGNGPSIVFKGKALASYDEFDKLVPAPAVPNILKGNKSVPDPTDRGYLAQLTQYNIKRFAYLAIQTLKPSEIEWDSVQMDKPETWAKWVDDLASHLSLHEQNQLLDFIYSVNCLSQAKIDAARNAFLAGLAQAKA